MKKNWAFLGPSVRSFFFASVVLGGIYFLVEISFIVVLQGFLVATGLLPITQSTLPDWYPTTIIGAGTAIVIFGIIRGIIIFSRVFVDGLVGFTFGSEKKIEILQKALGNATSIDTPRVIAVFTERLAHASIFVKACVKTLNYGFAMALFAVFGLWKTPMEMIIGVTLMALFVYPLKKMNRIIATASRGLVEEGNETNRAMIFGLKNNFLITVYGLVQKEIDKGTIHIRQELAHYISSWRVASLINALPLVIGTIIIAIVTILDIQYFGASGISAISFIYLFIRFAQAASDTSSALSELKLHYGSYHEVASWIEHLPEQAPPMLIKPSETYGEVVVLKSENLGFEYPSRPVFQNLSFEVKTGSLLLLKGPSGAGKSTLIALICGLLKPSVGQVTINGSTTANLGTWLKDRIAYVGPEPFLIPGSVRENLLYGVERQDVSTEEIWDALSMVDLRLLIEQMPLNLETPLPETAPLSTGQRQRISFARALLRKPKILILDEATSNVDEATEKKIIQALKELSPSMLTIVVSHRDSFDAVADKRIQF